VAKTDKAFPCRHEQEGTPLQAAYWSFVLKGTHKAPRVPFKQPSLPHSTTGQRGTIYALMTVLLA
jgi:hypothetical protein